MSEAFVSIKRKYLINALIISGAVGLSVGLLAVGVLMLIFKLTQTEFNPLWYVLIGVGGAILVGGILFLILRPTNKRLAKHLDAKFELNEKVQTMVEFDGKESDMVKLQRKDTDSRLSSVPAKAFNIKRWWAYLIAVVIAAGAFGTAFFIPEPEPVDDTPPEIEFDATEWQIARLEQLISDVKRTENFYQEAKNQIVVELEGLLDTMKLDYVTENQIISQVLDVIVNIHTIIDELISYNEIGEKMQNSSSDSNVQHLAKGILTLNSNTVVNRLDDIRETFRGYYVEEEDPEEENGGEESGGEENGGEESGGVQLFTDGEEGLTPDDSDLEGGEQEPEREFVDLYGEELFNAINSFTSSAKISMELPGIDTDNLYIKLSAFFDGLAELAGEIDNVPTERAQASLDTYFDENSSNVYDLKVEIENQADNRYERDNVVNRLLEIFGLTKDDLPESVKNQLEQEDLYQSVVENESNNDNTLNGGGAGTGNTQYGSNDLIYDPDNDVHVEYGEVLNEWYWEEIAKMEEAGVPQEIINLYNKYFNDYLTGNSSSDDNG